MYAFAINNFAKRINGTVDSSTVVKIDGNNKKTTTITVWDTRFMKQFKPNLIKAALISGGVAFVSTPTFAQESNSDSIDESNVEVIFTKLGFEVKKNNKNWNLVVPSWRNDVERSEDLVEEIIRIFGYEKIPTNVLPVKSYITKPSLGLNKD